MLRIRRRVIIRSDPLSVRSIYVGRGTIIQHGGILHEQARGLERWRYFGCVDLMSPLTLRYMEAGVLAQCCLPSALQ